MVTAEEIGRVAVFAELDAGRPRAARARGRRHQPRAGRVRRARGRRARAVRACSTAGSRRSSSSTASSASSASAAGRDLRRGADHARHACSPSASAPPRRRASCASSRTTTTRVAAVAPEVAQGGRAGSRPPHRRPARPPGPRGGAAAAPRDRRRPPLGRRLHRAAALPRPQPGHVRVGGARRAGRGRAVGRPAAAPRTTAGDPRRRRQDGGPPAAAPGRRAARASAPRPAAAEYDTVIVGAGPGRAGRRGVRRVRGPAHDRRRARGAGRAGRHLVADRELPRLPVRRLGRRAGEPRAPAGAPARRGDPRDARRSTRIDAATRQVHLDGGDVLRARTIILACGVSWRRLAIEGFDRLAGKGISYGAARSEAPNTHGLDVHIVGAGNSAGQAALFFSTHARSVTILCRGETLEKSMSRYLVDQLAARSNIRVLLGTEVVGRPRRRRRWRRSTSAKRDRARRRGSTPAACSSSSARTPRPAGCRRRSRSTSAATC